MDRKIMINELVAMGTEMGINTCEFDETSHRDRLNRYNTKALEKLHTKTTRCYEVWRGEQDRLAALPKDPDTLLALQAGLISQDEAKEAEMAKKASQTKSKETKPSDVPVQPEAKAESIEVRTLKAMNALLWPSEVIEIDQMTPSEVELEVKDNVDSVKPGDKPGLLKLRPKDGEEVWAYLCSLNKKLLDKDAKKVQAKAEKKAKAKAEKKASNGSGQNQFGHRIGSITDTIDTLLSKGSTMEQVVDEIVKNHGRDKTKALNKFKANLAVLKKTFSVTTDPSTKKITLSL